MNWRESIYKVNEGYESYLLVFGSQWKIVCNKKSLDVLEDENERADWELVEDSDLGDGKKGKDETFVGTVSEESPDW